MSRCSQVVCVALYLFTEKKKPHKNFLLKNARGVCTAKMITVLLAANMSKLLKIF